LACALQHDGVGFVYGQKPPTPENTGLIDPFLFTFHHVFDTKPAENVAL
jgi:hypothetical protein